MVLDIGTDQKVFKILILLMSNDALSFPKLWFDLRPLFFYNVLNLASLVTKFKRENDRGSHFSPFVKSMRF